MIARFVPLHLCHYLLFISKIPFSNFIFYSTGSRDRRCERVDFGLMLGCGFCLCNVSMSRLYSECYEISVHGEIRRFKLVFISDRCPFWSVGCGSYRVRLGWCLCLNLVDLFMSTG